MENFSDAAGLAALGFWLFIAAVVATGVWDNIRKREAQHETLRRIIESGQRIDDELVDKLIALTGGNKDLERDFRITALILLGLGPSLTLFGWIMGLFLAKELFGVMLSVGALLVCLSLVFYAAAQLVKKWRQDSDKLDQYGS